MKQTRPTLPVVHLHDDRQQFFAKANAAYKALWNDPQAWAAVMAEREELEGTLLDDLELENESSD